MLLKEKLFKNRSLWYKFTLLSVLPAVIATMVIAVFVKGSVERAMIAEATAKADALVDLTRRSLAHTFVIYNKNLLDNMVDGLGRLPSVSYALVIDSADDRILAHNDHRLDGKMAAEIPEASGRPPADRSMSAASRKAGRNLYAVSVPISIANQRYADLAVGFSLDAVQHQMLFVKRGILLVALLAVLVGTVLASLAARIISRPIHALARQARRAGEGDFDHRLDYESRDAIGHLADAFNRMLSDIKVAERTAELAVAKDRAEESDRLKSAFLAAMSHELRTPLNSIIGFTGIILQELVGPLNDEQVKQLTMVQDSAYHLLRLINDVLDLSKIEAGQLTVASEHFDLRDVIRKAVATVSPLSQQKHLPISVRIDNAVGAVTSDRRRVEQILLNLLNNAIKFTPSGQVTLTCDTDTHWITTRIQDTGIGIAPGDVDKLFIAFQQIEAGLSRRFEGTGLGLSICKKLVELLGGHIHAQSDGLGQGTTFTFTLPAGGIRP